MLGRAKRDVLLVLGLVLPLGCTRARVVTARDLIETPSELDGAKVVLVGRVQDVRMQMPQKDGPYTAFVVADGTGRVPVFARGTAPIGPGDLVEVRGKFHSLTRLGDELASDIVEANFVRPLGGAAEAPGTPVAPP